MSDDKLTTPEVCDLIGWTASGWRSYVARGRAPEPDGRHSPRVPWWYRSTIDRWLSERTKETP